MHPYRTHTCGELRLSHQNQTVRLSGWVHRKRDHGSLLFIDLRDHYGLTQCVIDRSSPLLATIEHVKNESVVTITGKVVKRPDETANAKLPTGDVELDIQEFVIQSAADPLPLQVNAETDTGEDVRLTYRFLDLRREQMQRNLKLRSDVIASARRRMWEQGFREYQTPILTSSSPEGARDFLVPSRMHPGKFYALPQAPQQFKQLLMIAGYDRYFQIAPCFRDEDARADRSPGEFYQLDFEMSYVTQDDVFATIEPVLQGLFTEFGNGRKVDAAPFVRIPYDEAMLKYGSDKPDLRNPLLISDVTSVFSRADVEFRAFRSIIDQGGVVRAIRAPKVSDRPRVSSGPKRKKKFALSQAVLIPIPFSSSATRKTKPRRWPDKRGPKSRRIWTSLKRTRFASAGSSISRCTNMTNNARKSTSATTRSLCRKAA